MDGSTGMMLEGAAIAIPETGHSTSSSRGGMFSFRDLSPGEYRLVVRYPGLEEQEFIRSVLPGETTDIRVELRPDTIVDLEEFHVTAPDTHHGMAQAIAMQRSAAESRVVAATDQFGDIGQGNIADYLKYLPGVSQDGYSISLRGLDSSFTNVTADGNPIASAASGEMHRRFEFEQFSIDSIESVEIFKTLTPDKPATNTGGSINLTTRSAFDRTTRYSHWRVFYTVREPYVSSLSRVPGVQSGSKMRPFSPNFRINHIDTIGRNIGVFVGVSQYELFGITDRSDYALVYDPQEGGSPDDPAVTAWTYLLERGVNKRRSVSTRVDWKITPETMLSASFVWNDFQMAFNQHAQGVYTGRLAPLVRGGAPDFPYSGGVVNGSDGQGFIQLSQGERAKYGNTKTFNLALVHYFDNGAKLDLGSYFSEGTNTYDDVGVGAFGAVYPRRSGVTVSISDIGAIVPGFEVRDSQGNEVDLNDMSAFNIPSFTSMPRRAVDTRKGLNADYFHPFRIGEMPLAVTVGARVDNRDRNVRRDYYRGGGGVPAEMMEQFIDDVWSGYDNNELNMPGRPWVDLRKIYDAYSHVTLPSFQPTQDGHFDEDAVAAYGRLDIRPHHDFLIVAGIRHERLKSTNLNRVMDELGYFKSTGNYGSVNLRYTPTQDLVLRAAVAQSVGLPDYGDLLPSGLDIRLPNVGTGIRGRVILTNPNLEPYKVMNYDIGAEYYLPGTGVLSATLFHKEFKNYIVRVTQMLTPEAATRVGFDIDSLEHPDEYDLTTSINVPEAGSYTGLELSYSQTLTFLPAPFNSIGLQVNHTWIDIGDIKSSRVFDSNNPNLDQAIREQVAVALNERAVKRQLNIVANWKYKRFGVMANLHRTGTTLIDSRVNPVRYFRDPDVEYMNEFRHRRSRTSVNLRLDFDIVHQVTAYIQFRDLFDKPFRFTSNGRLVRHDEKGHPQIEFGVRGWF